MNNSLKKFLNEHYISEEPSEITELFLSGDTEISSDFYKYYQVKSTDYETEVRYLPKEIGELINLETLEISDNPLKKLPKEIGDLKKLKKLTITSTGLIELPKEIGNLTNLEVLYIEHSNLNYLPNEISKLSNLKALIIMDSNIEELPDVLGELKSLEKLYLNSNYLIKIPSGISNLEQIEEIDFSDNKITKTPLELFSLPSLKHLYLYNNQITEIPRNIKNLIHLKTLHIGYNKLIELPSEIGKLENLFTFDIESNFITKLPKEIGELKKIAEFNCNDNKLKQLPKEIINLNKDLEFSIYGNELEYPPQEISEQGIEAIQRWFLTIQDEQSISSLNEAKLIFVGDWGVGKTTLIRNLINHDYKLGKHKSTYGFDTTKYTLVKPDFKYNIWDFGGQGKYRAVQQLFCSNRALYIYVESSAQEESKNDYYSGIKYWINYISAFGLDIKKNYRSPIVFTLSKSDLLKEDKLNFDEIINGDYNIKAFIKTSCKSGQGIQELSMVIDKNRPNTDETGNVKDKFNTSWIEVKKELEKIEKDYITLSEYETICNINGLDKKDSIIWLKYLDAIGSVIYFHDIVALNDKVILNPNWVKDAAYLFLKNDDFTFTKNECKEKWSKYGSDWFMLLDLMLAFEICYKISEEDKYIIPSLLPEKPLKLKEVDFTKDNLEYIIEIKPFMPAGIISRLIVRKNVLINEIGLCWQSGGVFEYESAIAEITEDWKNNKITIRIIGLEKNELFTILRYEILSIIKDIRRKKNLVEISFDEELRVINQKVEISKFLNRSLTSSNNELLSSIETLINQGTRDTLKEIKKIDSKVDAFIRASELYYNRITTELSQNNKYINEEKLMNFIEKVSEENALSIVDEIINWIDTLENEIKTSFKDEIAALKNKKDSPTDIKAKLKFGLPLSGITGLDIDFTGELSFNKLLKCFNKKTK